MAGVFRARKFFPGYELDYVGPNAEMEWGGEFVLATALEATRRAIDELDEDMHFEAMDSHIWDNRTGQTESAVFWSRAVIEQGYDGPRVWGEWGVEDRPRYVHEEDEAGYFHPVEDENGRLIEENVTTMDVAMFLEFGTIKMAARPWLYPVWDANKVRLPELVAKYYREIAASGAPTALRTPGGQFMSRGGLLG